MALFDNCVAAWRLDDLIDATGRGNTLTNNNGVTFVPGKVGNAGSFVRSSSQFLSKASSVDVELGSGALWEIGLWVKLTTKTDFQALVSKYASGATDYFVAYDQSQDWFIGSGFYGGGSILQVTANNFGSPSAGAWHCINCWYDGSYIYIAVNDGTPNSTGTATTDPSTSSAFRIGSEAIYSSHADALIDNVNIWKGRVLTSGERTEFYNAGNGVEFPPLGPVLGLMPRPQFLGF